MIPHDTVRSVILRISNTPNLLILIVNSLQKIFIVPGLQNFLKISYQNECKLLFRAKTENSNN